MDRGFKLNLDEGIKFILYTTLSVLLFMVIIPSVTIKSKNIEHNYLEQTEDSTIANNKKEVKDIVLNGVETVKVYITNENRIEEIDIEDYICGVISSEMPANFEIEALKAQSVAARTYLASKKIKSCTKANGADICDSVHCQVYTPKNVRLELWDSKTRDANWEKISKAVAETEGKVLSYNNELVLYPQFFSTSSGQTENSVDLNWADLPYLKSVESKGEEISPKFESEKTITINEFINTFEAKYQDYSLDESNIKDSIEVTSKSEAGSVKEIKIGDENIKGQDFRFMYGLNSSNFTYEIINDNIVFNCKGYGHGVGMSQWGANVMAKDGNGYEEILKHYYSGVDVTNLKFK